MKHEPEIGKLIEGEAHRDAIHIAVAPVTAGGSFHAGERVGFMPDGTVGIRAKELIGIIDPYLSEGVCKGERCYIFLFPKTITSLRHEWTHPAFEKRDPAVEEDTRTEKEKSEAWLRNAIAPTGVSYERYIGAVEEGDYINMGENEGVSVPADEEELKRHVAVVLGRENSDGLDLHPFSCSC